jgi:hypothetical protein
MMIKKFGLTIKLAHSKKIEMDPKYVNATKEYAKNVKFDPATRTMSGWKAGMPFRRRPSSSTTRPPATR